MVALALELVADPSKSDARTWYIQPDGSGDAPTIQAAIDSASAGDSVLVAAGTYTWTAQGGDHTGLPGPSMVNMRSGVTLRSESGPEVTILDAEGNGRVIRCETTANARIEGFTIQGGNAADPQGQGPGPFSLGTGGAILCRFGSSVVIASNVLRDNRARYIGGALSMILSDTVIQGNVISGNCAEVVRSGGVDISGGTADVRGNTIAANMGGGVVFLSARATFSENLLLNNTGGHGIRCLLDASVDLACNDLWGNTGDSTCSVGVGDISADPLVCITSAEYHVQSGSPCLPENNACGLLMGARGIGCTTTGVSDGPLPRAGLWVAASPNPFNPQTEITYALHPTVERVRLTIYDLRG